MVIVMPSLAKGDGSNHFGVDGTNARVVGLHAVEVSSAIDQPGAMQGESITQHGAGEEAHLERGTHKVVWYHHGHNETTDGHHHKVVSAMERLSFSIIQYHSVSFRLSFDCRCNSLLLEHDDGILLNVGHVNRLALNANIGMLLAHQPTHVGEEEATTRVMGIGVCVSELVMHTMITSPFPDAVLEGQRLAEHEEDA